MSKKILVILLFVLLSAVFSCKKTDEKNPYRFKNSDFEKGDLSDWELFGTAFTNNNIGFLFQDNQGIKFNQQGEFFYYGGYNFEGKVGYMISEPFKLLGNGKIGYLIGAGRDPNLTYVSIIDEDNQTIASSGNKSGYITNAMYRQVFELEDYIGKKLRIKVVDLDSSSENYSYINVDDFIINYQGDKEMSIPLKNANEYVDKNIGRINEQYRHTYHAMSQLNWSNDPNGLIWFNNEFHLFYQHNPYESTWGPMHWGHYTTKDFIKWERKPIALAPDQPYDSTFGAFSGTAIEKDGMLYLFYTSVANNQQTQSIAYSKDGINFIKSQNNPVIPSSKNPAGVPANDIRDPKVFFHNGMYYVLLGTKIGGLGQIVLYKSTDLKEFQYVGPLMNNNNSNEKQFFPLNGVFECPDFFIIDDQQVLLVSPQNLPKDGTEHENIHGNIYMFGSLNFKTGKWDFNTMREIDSGFDFYAPQTAQLPDGRIIMIAWMQMWDRSMPTQRHNWVGSYTLPRELSIHNGVLYQTPVREIKNYRQNVVSYENIKVQDGELKNLEGVFGKTVEIEVVLDVTKSNQVGIELFKGTHHATKVYFDKESSTVVLDRSRSGIFVTGIEANNRTRSASVDIKNGLLKLRIFLDVSSVEVFINDGEKTITALVYPDENDLGIFFYSIGGETTIVSLKKYDIIVD